MMKNIIRKWNSLSLIIKILIGLITGLILGLVIPGNSWISLLGTMFVGTLKAIAPLLVFVLVTSSLANAKGGNMAKFRTVIILYMISTLSAAVVAVLVNFVHPVTISLANVDAAAGYNAPGGLSEIVRNLLMSIISNPVDALSDANYISILFWAVVFGLVLKKAGEGTKKLLSDAADAISKVVRGVISCAPFGILGLVYDSVSLRGLEAFYTYGELVLVLVVTMLLVGFVVNPLIVGITLRHNPFPLIFKCFRQSGMTAFFTRSSAANIPVNMELCKELGIDEEMYSVSIPLGATINMDGVAIYLGVASVFMAACCGIDLTFSQYMAIAFASTVASIGTPGIPGGSLALMAMVFASAGIPVECVAVAAGIDRIIDMGRTVMSVTGDASCAIAMQRIVGKKLDAE